MSKLTCAKKGWFTLPLLMHIFLLYHPINDTLTYSGQVHALTYVSDEHNIDVFLPGGIWLCSWNLGHRRFLFLLHRLLSHLLCCCLHLWPPVPTSWLLLVWLRLFLVPRLLCAHLCVAILHRSCAATKHSTQHSGASYFIQANLVKNIQSSLVWHGSQPNTQVDINEYFFPFFSLLRFPSHFCLKRPWFL